MDIEADFKVSAPPLRWDEAGGIRIGQSRITLDSLLAAYCSGSTPEEITFQYSVLNLEEVYAAIAYYLSHRQEIDTYLEQRRHQAEQQRSQFVQNYNLANLRQRLKDRCPTPGELIGNASING